MPSHDAARALDKKAGQERGILAATAADPDRSPERDTLGLKVIPSLGRRTASPARKVRTGIPVRLYIVQGLLASGYCAIAPYAIRSGLQALERRFYSGTERLS